jgi:uncharacterized lipoprotein YddW (UPF0748 family)
MIREDGGFRYLAPGRVHHICPLFVMLERSNFVLVLLLFIAFAFPCAVAGQVESRPREVRGVWITNVNSDVYSSKQSLARWMDYFADNGFNVVFPVVWNAGFTLYPSDVMVEYFGPGRRQHPGIVSGRDVLQELIVEAHRAGLEVIPWFEYGFASHYGETANHILNTYPHWAARDNQGNVLNKNEFRWMNAFHSEVQGFMLSLIREVAERYDVDGIQGDDRLPALPSEGEYSEYTRALYLEETGRPLPSTPYEQSFMAWKAAKLTNFAGQMYRTTKAIDEHLIVSMSPSIYPWGLQQYLQDWPTWMDSSYVDIVHPQAYRYTIFGYKDLIHQMVGPTPGSTGGHVKPEHRHKLFPGILARAGSALNGPAYLMEAVRFNREMGIMGEVFFHDTGLGALNQYAADSLGLHHYQHRALMPGRAHVRRPGGEILLPADDRVTRTGTWITDANVAGFAGPMMYAQKGTGSTMTYDISMPFDAYFDVYVYQPVLGGRTTSAHYTVIADGDTTVFRINQQTAAAWVKLNKVFIRAGAEAWVIVDADEVLDAQPQIQRTYSEGVMLLLDRKNSPDAIAVPTSTDPDRFPARIGNTFTLHQNYPNPFNPTTTVSFTLSRSMTAEIGVYDTLGREVMRHRNQAEYPAGRHEVALDLSLFPGGVYFYRISTPDGQQVRSMVLLK